MKQPQVRISLLAALRALVPQRPLSRSEAERIAELQANRLRELLDLNEPRLPEEAISELPRIMVRRDFALSSSAAAKWDGGRWVIVLNPSEPIGRQRFSLAHEFKHALDHATRQWLYPAYADNDPRAEQIADYFAGCLLMPKRHVKRLVGERWRVAEMAEAFGVTPRAMQVRLLQLGLSEPSPRCGSLRRGVYYRQSRISAEIAA